MANSCRLVLVTDQLLPFSREWLVIPACQNLCCNRPEDGLFFGVDLPQNQAASEEQKHLCTRNLPKEAVFGEFHSQSVSPVTHGVLTLLYKWLCGGLSSRFIPSASFPFFLSSRVMVFCFICWEVFREGSVLIVEGCSGGRNCLHRALGYSWEALDLCCPQMAGNSSGFISNSSEMDVFSTSEWPHS